MREHTETRISDLDVDAIVEILETTPVTRGILFGSYARGDEWTTSDVDIAVEFDESLSSGERTTVRLQLIEQISSALGSDDVDVVPISNAPESLRREINEDGIVLHGPTEPLEVTDDTDSDTSHEERIARFDELLGELERVVWTMDDRVERRILEKSEYVSEA